MENPECAKPIALPCNSADNNQEVKPTENFNGSMTVAEHPCNNIPQASMPANQSTVAMPETNQPGNLFLIFSSHEAGGFKELEI